MLAHEDKQQICDLLCKALQATRDAYDLERLEYVDLSTPGHPQEWVYLHFRGGTRHVNVSIDSGTAMIRDIMEHLGC